MRSQVRPQHAGLVPALGLLLACHLPGKTLTFCHFFSISRWIKPAGIVIKHTTINLTFTGTLVAIGVYIIYINGMYAELKVKKLKNKTARRVCFIQEHKMVDLLIYLNVTKGFISMMIVCVEETQNPKAMERKGILKSVHTILKQPFSISLVWSECKWASCWPTDCRTSLST